MHELAIVQQVLEIVSERSGGARVVRIVLEIGKLSAVSAEAVRFCFDLATADTVAEGATLEIREPAGLARCRACGGNVVLERPFGQCVCGGSDLEWLSGDELKIREMEMA